MSGNGYGFCDSVQAPLTLITAFLRLARSKTFGRSANGSFGAGGVRGCGGNAARCAVELAVLDAYGVPLITLDVNLRERPSLDPGVVAGKLTDDVAALVVPSPNVLGVLEDWSALAEVAHQRGALQFAAANPVDRACQVVVGGAQHHRACA